MADADSGARPPARRTRRAAMFGTAAVVLAAAMPGVATGQDDGATAPRNPFAGSVEAERNGHMLFNETCAHCHGPDAVTGIAERNLRHLRLRYGEHMPDVFLTTVLHGRPEKGMPTWQGTLDEATIWKIYTYLNSIQASDD